MGTVSGRPAFGGYLNPFRGASVVPERIDQGVDYSAGPGEPIYALGPGIIRETSNSGWPGGTFIAEELTEGPLAGRLIYAAEDITPEVTIGQQVSANTIIGRFAGGGSGIEYGFAAPPPYLGESMAVRAGQWNSSGPETGYGKEMSDLIASLGGPPGIGHGQVSGTGGGLAPAGAGCAPALIILAAPVLAVAAELGHLAGLL